jgi:hypothetical protein
MGRRKVAAAAAATPPRGSSKAGGGVISGEILAFAFGFDACGGGSVKALRAFLDRSLLLLGCSVRLGSELYDGSAISNGALVLWDLEYL